MASKAKSGLLAAILGVGLMGGIGAWQLSARKNNLPPKTPAVGTTKTTIEDSWGEAVNSTAFTAELDGQTHTVVTAEYAKGGKRVEVEYDNQLMAKKVKQLE
jgi:hypothetical protein